MSAGPVTARWLKSGGDQDAAELGGHVGGGRLGFGRVSGGAGAAAFDVGGVVPGDGVPGDGDRLAGWLEGDGALDGGPPSPRLRASKGPPQNH
jgi:hypothetical protein